MIFCPTWLEKSNSTSERSAGASNSEPAVGVPLNGTLLGTNDTLGRNPPSVPSTRKFVVGLPAGLTATLLSAGTLVGAPPPLSVMPVGVPSSTYICKLRKRALHAFSMRSRYLLASTVTSGYTVLLASMVSPKNSGTAEMAAGGPLGAGPSLP